ncbi:hypothetical protein KAR91_40715 [Candidatus Pacearchaeota archaeon]|nr:hypothetical protein [Candidatus Pacearchaeota archaeon]
MKKEKGRPTKYNKKYCKQIEKFFNRNLVDEVKEDGISLQRKATEKVVDRIPCELPTFERFAFSIGVHRETLINWTEKHPEFFDAYRKCKDLQKDILIQHGLSGNYNATFAIFTSKNITDMKDKCEIDNTSSDGSMSPKEINLSKLSKKDLETLLALSKKANK